MLRNIWLYSALFISCSIAFAQANGISERCQTQLKKVAVTEINKLAKNYTSESQIDFTFRIDERHGILSLQSTGKEDGLFVQFQAPINAKNLDTCHLDLSYNIEQSCRFSSYGDVNFNNIPGVSLGRTKHITKDAGLSEIQKQQLRSVLVYGEDPTFSLDQLIQNTDDQEVLYQKVTLPDGRTLDYYRAYGGDNPYGSFFIFQTTIKAGENSDGDICISF